MPPLEPRAGPDGQDVVSRCCCRSEGGRLGMEKIVLPAPYRVVLEQGVWGLAVDGAVDGFERGFRLKKTQLDCQL